MEVFESGWSVRKEVCEDTGKKIEMVRFFLMFLCLLCVVRNREVIGK